MSKSHSCVRVRAAAASLNHFIFRASLPPIGHFFTPPLLPMNVMNAPYMSDNESPAFSTVRVAIQSGSCPSSSSI